MAITSARYNTSTYTLRLYAETGTTITLHDLHAPKALSVIQGIEVTDVIVTFVTNSQFAYRQANIWISILGFHVDVMQDAGCC